MKKKDARFLPTVVQQEIRYNAIELFLKGFSQVFISTILGVSTRSIYNWVKAYKESGLNGLKINKRGRSKGSLIKPWQSAQIVE